MLYTEMVKRSIRCDMSVVWEFFVADMSYYWDDFGLFEVVDHVESLLEWALQLQKYG